LDPEFPPDGGSGPLYHDEGPRVGSARDNGVPPEFEDRRAERQKYGMIKYSVEHGVPDVGGLGWRSKQGHVLKNQSYYSAFPNTNIWNNPAHAGPRTWKSFHGPRLRSDAALMETMDRLDEEQMKFQVKKMYVNTIRVQTLDRFYSQKVANEQKEIHHTWAPNRRAKKEYHDAHDRFEVELDSMPLKELKKVLTPCVLHGDREAVRNITQRIQREETWKETWRAMETQRRKDTMDDLEERMTYNHMLTDLAGQPTRRRDPNRKLPNNCTERLEELSRPKAEAHPTDVTTLSDYRGLVHIDYQTALEARFPGKGHEMSSTFREKAAASAAPGWPPPKRPETPHMSQGKKKRNASAPGGATLTRGSVPASANTLNQALLRTTDEELMQRATEPFVSNEAPPVPDQRSRSAAVDKIVNSVEAMSDHPITQSQQNSVSNPGSERNYKSHPPPVRSMVYPVLVETSPLTDEVRKKKTAARLGGTLPGDDGGGAPSSARASTVIKDFPMKDVKIAKLGVNLVSATGLRGADRNGLSDPYAAVRIPGRPKMKYSTRVIKASLKPVWRESCVIEEFYAGDELEFSIHDKDVWGNQCLGKVALPQDMLLPDGIEGDLELYDEMRPEESPLLRIKVVVLENYDPDGRLQAKAVRGSQESDEEGEPAGEICCEMDVFEASNVPVPRLGNFWMTPRGDMRNATYDGSSSRGPSRGAAAAQG
jgi:hypothetical protein